MKSLLQLLVLATLFLNACSTYESETPSSPSPPVQGIPPAATVTISERGFEPTEVQVTVGSYVAFVNTDARSHEIYSGVDHTRPECPEIDRVGAIRPGQSLPTRVFESPRTCAFHDFQNLGNQAFQGRIIVR